MLVVLGVPIGTDSEDKCGLQKSRNHASVEFGSPIRMQSPELMGVLFSHVPGTQAYNILILSAFGHSGDSYPILHYCVGH